MFRVSKGMPGEVDDRVVYNGEASGVLIQMEALQGFRELWEDSFDSVSQHRERVSAHVDAYPKIEARNFEVKGTCGHQQITAKPSMA